MMPKVFRRPRLKLPARMVHEAEQQALYFTLNVSTLAQAAAGAGGIIITNGCSKMKLPNGDEVVIRDSRGQALQDERELIYSATGNGTHWDQFDDEYKLAWPTLIAYIDLGADDGSFRPGVTAHLTTGRPIQQRSIAPSSGRRVTPTDRARSGSPSTSRGSRGRSRSGTRSLSCTRIGRRR